MSLSKELNISTNEKTFIHDALLQGVRIDGRGAMDMRALKIEFGHKNGIVSAQLGRTRAVACITADIVEPYVDRPAEGFLNFFVDFSPMASQSFLQMRQSDKSVEIARVVERGIRESRAIDTEALCIVSGKRVWSIRCDVHVVDHGGNLMDCVNIAAVTALLHFRRPDVTIMGENVTIHSIEDKQPVALSLHHIPIALSFSVFEIGEEEKLVLDPDLKEELVGDGSVTITLNIHREICSIQKAGGVAISLDNLLRCSQVAAEKTEYITKLIKKKIKDDENNFERRNLSFKGEEIMRHVGGFVQGTLPMLDPNTPQADSNTLKAQNLEMRKSGDDVVDEEEENSVMFPLDDGSNDAEPQVTDNYSNSASTAEKDGDVDMDAALAEFDATAKELKVQTKSTQKVADSQSDGLIHIPLKAVVKKKKKSKGKNKKSAGLDLSAAIKKPKAKKAK